ncbi:hypothetical protein H2199_002257 [Coniosporium tulheliwenetii]|uniref:Uncharacterized protein n=1 Tax=Coniosporium tulheliwenetii TaxID=3383036 RepID=A0ACC2ZI94_9PEZI|nr:hypothetical protein H2199_002257 [Cladosporium sp. JES 115]
MPPVRTGSLAGAKPVKTERTHEENQERAYIAASRRSDRSLEARIESARRASEIHKKRTGRALRVTEADVVNEEMYEEEDEDLPAQYRRLTAHLHTGSVDFNRRLQAYLASQHATRSALAATYDHQLINTNYAQHYPNAPHFAHHMMPQPMLPTQMLPPQMIHRSPQSYRQSPYPVNYQAHMHQRQASMSTSQNAPGYQSPSTSPKNTEPMQSAERRQNAGAAAPASSAMPTPLPQSSAESRPILSRSAASATKVETTQPSFSTPDMGQSPTVFQPMQHMYPGYGFSPYMQYGFEPSMASFSPFSTSLPMESQQLLGPALDPLNPHTNMLMAGSEVMQQPFYSYNPNPNKTRPSPLALNGMNGMSQTLAPGALDTNVNVDHYSCTNPPSASTEGVTSPYTPYGFTMDNSFGDNSLKTPILTRNNSAAGSATITPSNEWANFLDAGAWEDQPGATVPVPV